MHKFETRELPPFKILEEIYVRHIEHARHSACPKLRHWVSGHHVRPRGAQKPAMRSDDTLSHQIIVGLVGEEQILKECESQHKLTKK